MTYIQAKALKLIDRSDMLSPCGNCIYDGPIVVSEKGTRYKKGCQHPKVIGSCNENWRCWHPIQKDSRGFALAPRDAEWLIYFEPVPEFKRQYHRVIDIPIVKSYDKIITLGKVKRTFHISSFDNGERYAGNYDGYFVHAKTEKEVIDSLILKTQKVKLEESPEWIQPSLF